MDLVRDQDKILLILKETDIDDDDQVLAEPPGGLSDSESEDNLENDLVVNTDESEGESSDSSTEELHVIGGRNRSMVIESDEDISQCSQPCPSSASQQNLVTHLGKPYIGWPQWIFYNMLHLCVINMYVIYVSNMARQRQKPLKRRAFVQNLADNLIEPWLRERYETVTLRRDIKAIIKDILKIESVVPSTLQTQPNKRKICSVCPYQKHRMTKVSCHSCGKAICVEHTIPVCSECKD